MRDAVENRAEAPMSATEFRAALARIGLSQSGLARRMRELRDPRSFPTILRTIASYARGETPVRGEMQVILHLLECNQRD